MATNGTASTGDAVAQMRQRNPRDVLFTVEAPLTFHDPIHGQVILPHAAHHIVDHLLFQRMRDIKQLGMHTAYVYPNCQHTRFQHSLGTGHLALKVLTQLDGCFNETGKKLTVQDWVCVMTAALTHDLGHPSFSHTWEEVVKGMAGRNPTKYGHFKGWNHEKASTLLVEQLWGDVSESIESELGAKFTKNDLTFIQKLIDPPKNKLRGHLSAGTLADEWEKLDMGRPVEYAGLFEIVSNWRGGLDVDRLDYLLRDGDAAGVPCQLNVPHYINDLKLMKDELSSESSGVWTIANSIKMHPNLDRFICDHRPTMHEKVYRHPTALKVVRHLKKAIEMIDTEALEDLMRRSDVREGHWRPGQYAELTDDMVKGTIRRSEKARKYYDFCISTRNLMSIVKKDVLEEKISKEMISKELDLPAGCAATKGDVMACVSVDLQEFDRGNKDKHPLSKLLFYNSKNPKQKYLGRDRERDEDYGKSVRSENMYKKVFIFCDFPIDLDNEKVQYKYDEKTRDAVLQGLCTAVDKCLKKPAPDGCRSPRSGAQTGSKRPSSPAEVECAKRVKSAST